MTEHLRCVQIVIDDNFNPWRREHVINIFWVGVLFVSPIMCDSAQTELNHHIVAIQQSVHVSMQTFCGVYRGYVKLYFDEIFRISSDDEVDVCPVGKEHPLDVRYNFGQSLSCVVAQALN